MEKVLREALMTRFERAMRAAESLPPAIREKIGAGVLEFVDRHEALARDLEQASAELDAGRGIPAEEVFADLRRRLGMPD
jgi:predicted transcriptional regulator